MEDFIFDLQRFDEGWQNVTASSIEYQQDGTTLFTIDGLSKSDYLTPNLTDSVVAVGESALWERAKDTITIDNDDYKFSFSDISDPIETQTISGTNATIDSDGVYQFADDFTGTVTITATNVKLIGAGSTLNNVYIDASGVEGINLWIENLNITTPNYGNNLIKFGSGDNYLTVKGDNTLINTANDNKHTQALINSGSGTLNITGDGSLTAQLTGSKAFGAAIGSDQRQILSSSDINIGGSVTVNATAKSGAGIGSGNQGRVATINIGGNAIVTATGATGAGIGTGSFASHAGDINIGGNATVTASSQGSGIGQGTYDADHKGTVGTITYGTGANVTNNDTKITGTNTTLNDLNVTAQTNPSGDDPITAIYGTLGGAGWYLNNNIATFNTAGASNYFTLESRDRQITYHEETLGEAQVQIAGISTISGLSLEENVVMLSSDNIIDAGATVQSNEQNYKFEISGGNGGKSFTGTENNDTISNGAASMTINGGAGDDSIYNYGNDVTINISEGNDTILINAGENGTSSLNVTGFSNGDVIAFESYVADDNRPSLSVENLIVSGGYLLATLSNSAVVSIGGMSFTETTSTNWTLDGNTANFLSKTDTIGAGISNGNIVYGNIAGTSLTIAALTNIKSLGGLSVNDKVITISDSALDGKTVELTSEKDYSITIAADVDTLQDDLKSWNIENGSLIYYAGGKGDYYSLSGNKLTYNESVAGTAQIELSGVSGNFEAPDNGIIKLNAENFVGNVEIVSNAGNYSLILDSGEYNRTFTGTSGADKIENAGSSITIDVGDGNDEITNTGDNILINAGDGNDEITNSGDNVTIDVGSGSDIVDWQSGDGEIRGFTSQTTLQIEKSYSMQLNGDDLIITAKDIGTITIIGGAANVEEYISNNIAGKPINNPYTLTFNNKAEQEETLEEITKKAQQATSVTLQADFEGTLDATAYKKLTTIKSDKNLTSDVEILGNYISNTITSGSGDDTIDGGYGNNKIDGGAGDDSIFGGGTGNDTLTGGKGYDIFVYDGKGKDKITDYTAGEDTVSLTGALKRASVEGNKVIFRVGRTGTLTLDKAVGKKITYTDETGEEITETFRKEGHLQR